MMIMMMMMVISQCANRQSSWRFLKTSQIMEEQENQFASENKAL